MPDYNGLYRNQSSTSTQRLMKSVDLSYKPILAMHTIKGV